jgi:hypothetical protein
MRPLAVAKAACLMDSLPRHRWLRPLPHPGLGTCEASKDELFAHLGIQHLLLARTGGSTATPFPASELRGWPASQTPSTLLRRRLPPMASAGAVCLTRALGFAPRGVTHPPPSGSLPETGTGPPCVCPP